MREEETARSAVPFGLRLRHALAGASLLLVLGLIFGAGPAAAENLHLSPTGSYGKEADPTTGTGNTGCKITYQEAEKRLYLVTDGKVYGLEITSPGTATVIPGYPISPGLGNNLYCSNTDIQVDNTGGSSSGRYYTTVNGSEITAFNPDGTRVPSPWPALSTSLCSTAVLPNGDVWGFSQFPQPPTISRFTASGEQLSSLTLPGNCPQMAIDQVTGDLYMAYGREMRKYTAASNYTEAVEVAPIPREYGDYVVNGALHKVYVATESGFEAFDTETGERIENVATGGEVRSITLDEASDTVFAEVGGGPEGRILEYRPQVVPTPTTESATGEGLVSGNVEALANGPVTSCEVEYGFSAKERTETYEHSVPCSPAAPYLENSSTPITAQLTGLTGETLYHYRVVAANATGKGFGGDMTFTPHYVQNVLTEAPAAVTTSSATLKASYDGNGEDTHYLFEWGLEGQPYEHSTPLTDAHSPSAHTEVSEAISGLVSDTAYHYRVVMQNPKGNSPGNDVEFSTANAVKDLDYEPVSALTSTSVTLNSKWDGEGGLDTTYFFEWGFASGSGFEHTTPATPADGGSLTGVHVHSVNLSGLVSNANYRYRVIATNSLGTSTGATMTFKTLQFPSVTYLQASKYEPEAVTLNANVNPNGGGVTTFHFDYGLTSAYGSSTPESEPIGSDSSDHLASATITGLAPGTTYHYRIVATAPGGSYVSETDQVFTTLPVAPTIFGSAVSDRSPTGARLSAEVKPGFGATVVYFQYGTTPEYGSATVPGPALVADDEAHPVDATLAGLTPDTTYHYKVVAINFNGASTSSDLTFATGGTPRVGGESAGGVTDTSANISAQIDPNLAATTFHVEYGPSSSFGSSTAESPTIGSDEASHSVGASLTGLTPGTIYHYRVVASNPIASGVGEESTFITATPKAEPPPKVKCKKGFVKRNGKCVKKKKQKKKKNHKHSNRPAGV